MIGYTGMVHRMQLVYRSYFWTDQERLCYNGDVPRSRGIGGKEGGSASSPFGLDLALGLQLKRWLFLLLRSSCSLRSPSAHAAQ